MGRAKSEASEIHKLLAQRILTLRVDRGWTQDVLAELAGVHRNYIGHLEHAEHNVGLENIFKLATAFEMPIGELLTFPVNQYGKDYVHIGGTAWSVKQ
jgi:transcriptional regulator with XRE-family HTH domain